jgi:hypothetical protein
LPAGPKLNADALGETGRMAWAGKAVRAEFKERKEKQFKIDL